MRILIVDDDDTLLSVVAEILTLFGCLVETASSAIEALQVLDNDHPNLVLSDVRLPDVDVATFAAALRQMGSDVPLLLMSGEPSGVEIAKAIGAVGFLEKPFSPETLRDQVAGAATSHGLDPFPRAPDG
jgi:DNA-binding NtrC family response regulator